MSSKANPFAGMAKERQGYTVYFLECIFKKIQNNKKTRQNVWFKLKINK